MDSESKLHLARFESVQAAAPYIVHAFSQAMISHYRQVAWTQHLYRLISLKTSN